MIIPSPRKNDSFLLVTFENIYFIREDSVFEIAMVAMYVAHGDKQPWVWRENIERRHDGSEKRRRQLHR